MQSDIDFLQEHISGLYRKADEAENPDARKAFRALADSFIENLVDLTAVKVTKEQYEKGSRPDGYNEKEPLRAVVPPVTFTDAGGNTDTLARGHNTKTNEE